MCWALASSSPTVTPKWPRFPGFPQTLGSSYKGSEFGWLVTVVSVAVGIDSQGEFLQFAQNHAILLAQKVKREEVYFFQIYDLG